MKTLKHFVRSIRLVTNADMRALRALTLLTLFSASLPLCVAYTSKNLIEAIIAGPSSMAEVSSMRLHALLFWVTLEGVIVLATLWVDHRLSFLRHQLGDRLRRHIAMLILKKAGQVDLEYFGTPEFYDKLTRARKDCGARSLSLVQQAFGLARSFLVLAGCSVVLFRYSNWALLALLGAAVPPLIWQLRFSSHVFGQLRRRSPEQRQLVYLEQMLGSDTYAKEIKFYGAGRHYLGRYRRLAAKISNEQLRYEASRATGTGVLAAFSSVILYCCYAAVALSSLHRECTVGDVILYLTTFRYAQNSIKGCLATLAAIHEDSLYMSSLFVFLGIDGKKVIPRSNGGRLVVAEGGIRFENVSFRYPGTQMWVVSDASLFVPTGARVAVVGSNGAGKSTLIKLACGLYKPDRGRILVDGKDLRDWEEEVLRARFSVIFQDFNRYQLTVRDNVAIADLESRANDAELWRAMDISGARTVCMHLQSGLDTQLGSWFQSGVELSGGQWQRIALARAFLRSDARIMIFDEPTAALDMAADKNFEQVMRLLDASRTALVVTHRTRLAMCMDFVIVMERGAIVQSGTSGDLSSSPGIFRDMCLQQAH